MAGKRENVQKREFFLEPWQEPILKGRRVSRGGVPDMLQWGFPLHMEMRFHGLTLKHRVAREYNCTVAFRSRASDGRFAGHTLPAYLTGAQMKYMKMTVTVNDGATNEMTRKQLLRQVEGFLDALVLEITDRKVLEQIESEMCERGSRQPSLKCSLCFLLLFYGWDVKIMMGGDEEGW